MVNINQAFPSKWIKADDLKGQRVLCVIDRVVMEDIGDSDRKPVMYFQGHDKGMVLNKTNAETIGYVHGPETDSWSGLQVELFTMMVPFQGRNVPAIRCRAVPAPAPAAPNLPGEARMSTPLGTPVQSENPADGFPGDAQTTSEAIDDSLPPGF